MGSARAQSGAAPPADRSWWRRLAAPAVYREEREQRIVADYLRGPPGIFVEVGAYDPVDYSQTYHLEQAGWSGILVEPVREAAEKLRRQRRARVFEVACAGPEDHGATRPLRIAGALTTLRAKSHVTEFVSTETRDVRLVTLDSLLDEAGIERVDFLSVDVEGAEIDVLRGFSFARFRPRLLLIEDFADDLARHRYVSAQGYKRVRRTGNNSWYVPRETEFPVSAFGRWQLLRKYCLALPVRWLRRLRPLERRIRFLLGRPKRRKGGA